MARPPRFMLTRDCTWTVECGAAAAPPAHAVGTVLVPVAPRNACPGGTLRPYRYAPLVAAGVVTSLVVQSCDDSRRDPTRAVATGPTAITADLSTEQVLVGA